MISRDKALRTLLEMEEIPSSDLNSAVRAEIEQIPDDLWRPYRGRQIAQTVHFLNRTNNAFRLIVHRKPLQSSLPGVDHRLV